jgi:hypothetical protein
VAARLASALLTSLPVRLLRPAMSMGVRGAAPMSGWVVTQYAQDAWRSQGGRSIISLGIRPVVVAPALTCWRALPVVTVADRRRPGSYRTLIARTLLLPGFLVLAALLVVVVGSRVPEGHRVATVLCGVRGPRTAAPLTRPARRGR